MNYKIFTAMTVFILGASFAYASIDKNLYFGKNDPQVKELQGFLASQGFFKGTQSNFFGSVTLKAVKAYQKSIGVSPTGYVGALTRQKITVASNPCGPTENCVEVLKGTISRDCAPSDDAALSITMPYNGGRFRAMLYSHGLEDFKSGKSVIIQENASSSEVGFASVCNSDWKNCSSLGTKKVKISTAKGTLQEGSSTRLNIDIDGSFVPVDVDWSKERVMCG